MMLVIAIAAVMVFLAMMVDLATGMYKAKCRNEAWRSDFLKRTGLKFALYEGAMLIAACADILIHFSHLCSFLGMMVFENVPLLTIAMGLYWCTVEWMSVREKADEKIHSKMAKADKIAESIIRRELFAEVIAEAMRKAAESEKKKEVK